MKTLEYKTTTGKTLKLKAVHPSLINRLTSGIQWPERPYYTREIAGGEIEKIFHDETSLQTPEEFRMWETYLEAMSAAEEDYFRRKVKLYIRHGVELQEEGIAFRSEEDRISYVEEQCIGTMTDVMSIIKGIDKLSTIDWEALAEVEKMFRDQMEGNPTS